MHLLPEYKPCEESGIILFIQIFTDPRISCIWCSVNIKLDKAFFFGGGGVGINNVCLAKS